MPARIEEITATIIDERFRFGEGDEPTVILDATGAAEGTAAPCRFALKGKAENGDPAKHMTYRFYGRWTNYTNQRTGDTERQFHFKTFVKATPLGRAGVIKYLTAAPGIGPSIARQLWEKFESNAVKILREQPDVAAAAVERLSLAVAETAAAYLHKEKSLEDCTIATIDLLEGRGFPKSVAKKAISEFGNRAADIIRQNPYLLMRFRGCGFKRADALYLDLGLPPAKLKRQALCAWHHLARNTEGHTWHYQQVVDVGLKQSIGGAEVRVGKAVQLATRAGLLCAMWTDGVNGEPSIDGDCQWLAEGRKARNEWRLAEYVREAMRDTADWPEDSGEVRSQLSDHQWERVCNALSGPIAILGGSPGTGKTFTAAKLIGYLGRQIGWDQIAVMAPTGKAAVRISEAMNQYGLPLRAKTIHSTLKVQQADGDGWTFEHSRSNPLPFRVLVVDESSMIDTDLAASLFAARARGTLVLLVGDVGQLPPVGHGAPLRDMIAAGVPYGELTEIRRNSGQIVEACGLIRQGRNFACGGNLIHVGCNGASSQIAAMLATLKEQHTQHGLDPVWDCQVLVPVNKKSELARKTLNEILQAHLNPAEPVRGNPFRVGDKVVNTKNGWFPLAPGAEESLGEDAEQNADGKVYVANGELGRVVRNEANYMHVALQSPDRLVVVPRGQQDDSQEGDDEEATGTGCNWDLGYALSCHKAQGSEWGSVIVMIDDSGSAARVCSREWVYTAISRAKERCYLVGKLATAHQFTRRTAIDKRKTFLRELIATR